MTKEISYLLIMSVIKSLPVKSNLLMIFQLVSLLIKYMVFIKNKIYLIMMYFLRYYAIYIFINFLNFYHKGEKFYIINKLKS